MALYTKKIRHEKYTSKNWESYTSGLHPCFLDIETTGLSSRRDQVILSGVSSYADSGTLLSRQYFCENLQEERDLVASYLTELSKREIWVSYNGDSFDLPFLRKRARHLGIADDLPFHYSLDLYQVFRWYSPFPQLLPDLKQKTIEEFLGFDRYRRDEISGKESAELYTEYLRTKDSRIREVLLLHNSDDVCQLPQLLRSFDKLDLHRIMYKKGFPFSLGSKRLVVNPISLDKNGITAQACTAGISGNYHLFESCFEALHSETDHILTLKIPCGKLKGSAYVDLEAFDMDFSDLEASPAYASGFLILKEEKEIHCREINHLLKRIYTKILPDF